MLVPTFTNYLHGDVWCIEPNAHRNLQELARMTVCSVENKDPVQETLVIDGLAQIDISGVMVPACSQIEAAVFGLCSVEEVEARIDSAMMRDDVKGILFEINTPGGYSLGIPELAEKVASINKPCVALVRGQCASAGYWVACSMPIVVSTLSSVGSIGCYLTVKDYSKTFEMAGVKTIQITTGDHKGAGEPGTEITEAQIAHLRDEVVAPTGKMFFDFVSEYRGLDESLYDGRAWRGSRAVELGLAEKVGGYDDAMILLKTLTRSR